MVTAEVSQIASAFDAAAKTYDEDFGRNPVGRAMREHIWETYLQAFKPGDRVLDLNAGTGIDAIHLAKHGIHVHAIDISPGMLSELSGKVSAFGLEERITYEPLSFDSLQNLNWQGYDGAISNFGGLNCIQDLSLVARELAKVLQPGARFIATVMGRFCPVETLAFLSRGKIREAFRRMARGAVLATVAGRIISVNYFTPREFESYFDPFFNVESVYSVGVCLPPTWKSNWASRSPHSLRLLLSLDRLLGRLPLLRTWGDHTVIFLRRNPVI